MTDAPTFVFFNAPVQAWEALIALGTPKLMLATDTYVPAQATHDFVSDVTNEAAGTGYTSGGNTLANVTVSLDTDTGTVTITCDDVTGISVSCRYALFVIDTGTDATSPVVSCTDFTGGGNTTLTGTTSLSTAGLLQDVVAAA